MEPATFMSECHALDRLATAKLGSGQRCVHRTYQFNFLLGFCSCSSARTCLFMNLMWHEVACPFIGCPQSLRSSCTNTGTLPSCLPSISDWSHTFISSSVLLLQFSMLAATTNWLFLLAGPFIFPKHHKRCLSASTIRLRILFSCCVHYAFPCAALGSEVQVSSGFFLDAAHMITSVISRRHHVETVECSCNSAENPHRLDLPSSPFDSVFFSVRERTSYKVFPALTPWLLQAKGLLLNVSFVLLQHLNCIHLHHIFWSLLQRVHL